jgi:pimeloyl-ACP methyl ester carboxylesterase
MEKRFAIDNNGRKIAAVVHLSSTEERFPWVVTSHGFFSSKESDKFIAIGKHFSQKRIAVLRFDFSGCGESDGRIEDTTLSQRVQDLQSVLSFLKNEFSVNDGIGLLGSSLGGCVSILAAAKDPEIKALVTLAAPAHFRELFTIKEDYYESGGERIEKAFIDDVKKYDIISFLKKVNCPVLIVHGDKDEEVPVCHARILYREAKGLKRLEIIEGGDHRLSDIFHRKLAINLSLNWFTKHLIGK